MSFVKGSNLGPYQILAPIGTILSAIARRYWKTTFCLALVLRGPTACFAAERYVFDLYDRDRGLGNATVTRLAKDHQGFLWIGTENGLYRYDGHRFRAFTTSDGLPGNKITAIHESPDGTLWVGTLEGLAWREGQGFRKATGEVLKGPIPLQGIASDSTGRIFIATRNGVAVTSSPDNGKDLQMTFLAHPSQAAPRQRVTNVYVAAPDEVWFGCDIAICRWNGKDVQVWDRKAGVPPHKWDFLLRDKSGNLWARSRDALIELASRANRFQAIDPHLIGQISIAAELAMDRKGRILVTTDRGLVVGGPRDWRRVTEKQGLPTSFVTAVLQDDEGSMWVGALGAGLVRWAGYDAWKSFTELEGLASSSILSLLDDPPSGVWAGTAAGLSHAVFSAGTWNWSEVAIPGVGWASSLVRAKDGALWMLTDGHFVVRYDPVSHTSRRLGPFGQGPFHLRIDRAGRLWIADSGSLAVAGIQSELEDIERIRPPDATERTIFTATLEDAHGDLWIGSMSGLFRRSQGKWFRYDEKSGLRANRVTDLTLSPEGDVWVSYSEPKGTDRVRLEGDAVRVENFDRTKGLISDRVHSTAFDRKGQLWILNDQGVEVRRGDTWVHFSRIDGLITSGSMGRAFLADANGAIWIGSERGLSRYEPVEAAEAPPKPLRVRYSEVRMGQTALDPELGAFVETTPQAFEAKFSALLLAHGPEVRYRYRIAGFDDRWQETAEPEARLDYLPPGRYRLEVQARRDAQPWSGPAATLSLEVRPRWYETPFFRGTILALVCALVWLLAKLRQRSAAAARQTLELEVEKRTAQLRESEERLKNAERLAHVGHWSLDVESNDADWSVELCRIFGKPEGYTPNPEDFWEIFLPEDREQVKQWVRESIVKREGSSIEVRITRPDGDVRTILCTSEISLDGKSSPVRLFGACQDITELRRAQQAVIERQKLESLGTLAGGIAHDFNNLLGGVLAEAELALEEYRAALSPEEELKRIRNTAIRGSEIVRQMMIYAGKETEAASLVDVSRIADEMLELLGVSVSKHATLETRFGEGMPAVRADAGQIRQIVMNLVTNASEALGDRDGVIRVTTARVKVDRKAAVSKGIPEGDYLELEVADTGPGISPETQARVFDPFFTTKPTGHGLGLAVVQGIVRELDGAIQLSSELGKGATFQILLPCAEATAGERELIPQGREPAKSSPGATVLLVEDEEAIRLPLSTMLRRRGFEILEAANGSVAIDHLLASDGKIDVMLLDMTIPGPSSREIAAVAAEARPGLKVVLTSAHDEQTVRATVGAPQECSFIRKPFQVGELVQTLQNVL